MIRPVLDDTLAPKKGPHVFGLGCHIDAVRSTRRHKIFTFGHVWVTLAILLPVPFSIGRGPCRFSFGSTATKRSAPSGETSTVRRPSWPARC